MRGNVLIMAGGTGGHVFPALACAREFQARGYAVHWLGTPRGIENELVPQAGLPLHLINVSGLRGKGKLSLLKAPFQLLRSLLQARRIVRELQPVCVLGMGGYVTGPGGLAARMAGVPLVISHHKCAGPANWGRTRETLPLIDALGQRSGPGEAVIVASVSHNLKLVTGPADPGFAGPVAPAVADKLASWLRPLLGA